MNGGSAKNSMADGSIRSESTSSSLGDLQQERMKLIIEIEDTKKILSELNENHLEKIDKFIANSNQVEKQKGLAPDNPQLAKVRTNFDKINRKHTSDVNAYQKRLELLQSNLDRIERGDFAQLESRKKGLTRSLRRNIRDAMIAPIELAHKLKASVGPSDTASVHSETKSEGRIGHSTFFTNFRNVDGEPLPAAEKAEIKLTDRQCNNFSQHFTMDINLPIHTSTPLSRAQKKKSASNTSLGSLIPIEDEMNADDDEVDVEIPDASEHQQSRFLDTNSELAQRIHNLEEHHMKLAKDVAREFSYYEAGLEEVRFKITKLEGLLNETIELHQAEFASLKEQNVISTRIDFQHNDRFTDMREEIGKLQNQLIKLENFVKDTVDNRSDHFEYKTNFGSAMNFFVEFLKLVLFFFAAILELIKPITSSRKAGMMVVVLLSILVFGTYIPNLLSALIFMKEKVSGNSSKEKTEL